MILLKSIKGIEYEVEPCEGAYKLFRIDQENKKSVVIDSSIKIENHSPYPLLIQVDEHGFFSRAKHSIPISFNYSILDFLLRCLCLILFLIGFLSEFDFWVLQIVIIGPVLFYQVTKKKEKTIISWQQSYRLHYEQNFSLKFHLEKLLFEPQLSRLFLFVTLAQTIVGTVICWWLMDFGIGLKITLIILLFFILLYYNMLLSYAGLSRKIPLNNQEEAAQKFRVQRNEEIIEELQTNQRKEAEFGILSILKFVAIYVLIFHLDADSIQNIARFLFSIYNEFQNLFD